MLFCVQEYLKLKSFLFRFSVYLYFVYFKQKFTEASLWLLLAFYRTSYSRSPVISEFYYFRDSSKYQEIVMVLLSSYFLSLGSHSTSSVKLLNCMES